MIILFFIVQSALAEDWMIPHQRSETMSLTEVQQLVRENSKDKQVYYMLGLKYLEDFDFIKAREVFRNLLDQNSDSFQARWGLAEVDSSEHFYDQSRLVFQEIIRDHPEFIPAYISLAKIAYNQLSLNECIRYTSHVISFGKRKVDHRSLVQAHGLYAAGRGLLAYHGGPFSKTVNGFASLRHLRIIKNLAPDSFIYYYTWGNFYAITPRVFGGDIDRAKRYFQKTIEMKPLFADAYARLAQVHHKKGEFDQYEANLNKALRLDPQNELARDVQSRNCQFICLEFIR